MFASVEGPVNMSLQKFIIGMVFALAIVVGWSYFDGASLGTILIRAVVCAVIIQAGYFLLVFATIARSPPTSAEKTRDAERGTILDTDGDKLGARRGSLH
jgi:exopolysaccharide production repressor protein